MTPTIWKRANFYRIRHICYCETLQIYRLENGASNSEFDGWIYRHERLEVDWSLIKNGHKYEDDDRNISKGHDAHIIDVHHVCKETV